MCAIQKLRIYGWAHPHEIQKLQSPLSTSPLKNPYQLCIFVWLIEYDHQSTLKLEIHYIKMKLQLFLVLLGFISIGIRLCENGDPPNMEYFRQTYGLRSRSWVEINWLLHHRRIDLIGRNPADQMALNEHMANVTLDDLRARFLGDRTWNFTPNEFPYWTADDVHHWVLWFDRERTDVEIEKELDRRLQQPYVWMANPRHLQSVSNTYHVQVFFDDHKTPIRFC